MKRHDAMAGRPLDEDITVTVLIEPCVKTTGTISRYPPKKCSTRKHGPTLPHTSSGVGVVVAGPIPLESGDHEEE